MKETARIADQLERAYSGKAWHGPSLRFLLRGITAAQAAQRPIPNAHTIWELVLHITAWDRVVCERIQGGKTTKLPPDENFPTVSDTSEAAWKKAIKDLEQQHRALAAAMLKFPPAKLDRNLSGGDYTYYITMHGAVQHDLYHAGQIAILKKMVE
jgi:uncharacterized damage-inducible protein DinB